MGLVSNGFSIADPDDAGMLDVVGFDASAPEVMSRLLARGFLSPVPRATPMTRPRNGAGHRAASLPVPMTGEETRMRVRRLRIANSITSRKLSLGVAGITVLRNLGSPDTSRCVDRG